MAAQSMTAAALLDVQARLTSLFAEGVGPSAYELNSQIDVQTVRAMLANHVADTMPITDANGNCRGFSVYNLEGRADTLDYDDTGDNLTLTCDIPSGDGLQANATPYDLNLRKIKNREVDDNLCGNLFRDGASIDMRDEAATLVARNLLQGMQAIHRSLNIEFINFLDTGKTGVNNDSSLPSGITYGADTFTIDEAVLSTLNPDTLTELETVAQNNDISNWFIVAGRHHFRNAAINSQWNVLNDDQRSQIRWQQARLAFDQKWMDATLTGKNSFIIDPGSFLFYDHIDPTLTQLPFEVEADKWEFFIEDPILMINTPRGLRPLRYTVHYQKICSTINTARMRNQFVHRFRIILNAGLHLAPAAVDGHTGILKFKSA